MATPSVDEIKTWICEYYCKNEIMWNKGDFVTPFVTNWFITNQRNEWIASEKPFSSMEELVFGVRNPSRIKKIKLANGLHYYGRYYTPHYESWPWQVYHNEPNVSDRLAIEIRKEFPGMPMHFINVSVAFLHKSVPASVFKIVQLSCQSLVTFLMICNRMNIPPEIIHHILINLNIDTFNDTAGNIKFLVSGKNFKDAIARVNHASIDIKNATRFNSIIQVIYAFERDC